MSPVSIVLILSSIISMPGSCLAQSNASAAAGLAAGAALGANAAQGSTTSTSAGGANAPIEMNIMVYGGIKQIADQITADVVSVKVKIPARKVPADATCSADRQILLEDSTIVPILTLNATWISSQSSLGAQLAIFQKQVEGATAQIKRDQDSVDDVIRDFEQKKYDAAHKTTKSRHGKIVAPRAFDRYNYELNHQLANTGTPTTAGTGSSASSGSSSATTPIGLTYLGDVGTALSTAKNGITYSPSSLTPAMQALTTALTKALCDQHIALFTPASTINLPDAAEEITTRVSALQAQDATIQSALTSSTALPTPTDDQKGDPVVRDRIEKATADIKAQSTTITSVASSANALLNSFLSWQSGSDGNGSIILTDVIRGAALKSATSDKIPALQVNIDAAGGNTRTNSFFLFNLFYTPKPSFDAGVVVTYELRDWTNTYIAGDTLKALYDYSKWKPCRFAMSEGADTNSTSLNDGRTGPEYTRNISRCKSK